MNFTFENQGTHTYLVYTVGEDETMDSMSLGMLTNNKIPGLAQTLFTQLDSTKYIKYDVSAKISVSQFFGGQVNKKRLLGVFNGIVDALLSAEDYMLDVNSVLLDLDYIYADVSTCETVLICIPTENLEQKTLDLGEFFKNIMFTTQFDQTENCDHVAKIINYLNSSPVFSLNEFKNVLDSIGTGAPFTAQSAVQGVQNTQFVTPQTAQRAQNIPSTQPAQMHATPKPDTETSASSGFVFGRTVREDAQSGHGNAPQPMQNPNQVRVQPQNTPPMPPRPNTPPASGMPAGMAIPNGSPATRGPQTGAAVPPQGMQNGEKQMSMLDLLTHYNKENAAIYKAQKEARKSGMAVAGTPSAQQGFAIPGQSAAPAAPQRPMQQMPPRTPSAQNAGFAIPGQPTPPVNQGIPQRVQPQQQPPVAPAHNVNIPANTPAPQQPVKTPPTLPNSQIPQGRAMNFGETTVLGAGNAIGETTVLGATPDTKVQPYLVRLKNNEKINIDKPVFRIGKERSYVDYFIADNSAISRSHANIISKGGEYFIVDTNSTNHTYVNGVMINSNVETKLTHKTRLRLANEEFELNLC